MLPAVLGALLLGCNDLTVGDLNNPGAQTLQDSPTRSGALNLATGLQVGSRYNLSEPTGYNILLGMLGREIYNLACSDPRFFGEFIVGPMDGGSPAFGGNQFTLRYSNIRTGNILLRALAKLPTDPPNPQAGLTTTEKQAITGYTQTLQAYDFLRVINTRDSLGAPVDVDIDPLGPPAAIKTRAEVFQHITNLLDSAVAHLAAGGSTFPFPLSTGYAGFDTPPTFIKFNRALRARVAAYLGTPAEYAIMQRLLETFPDSTFLDVSGAPASFATGVYHSFSGASGDLLNVLHDQPNPKPIAITINPALVALRPVGLAQPQTASTLPDKRIVDKTISFSPDTLKCSGISSAYASNVYTSNTAPIPIIRNEELILLRAEERIFNGNTVGAVSDLNIVRQGPGNLAPYAGLTDQTSLVNELLYNRLYSLLFEGGHRWIDLRRFNQLTTIPQENTTQGLGKRFSRMPFPTNECLIRNPPPAQGCSPENGF
jgi:hypothetical protein